MRILACIAIMLVTPSLLASSSTTLPEIPPEPPPKEQPKMPDMKHSVVIWPGLHPRLEAAIERMDRLHIRVGAGRPTFITSARDSKHAERSKHYSGQAIDIRTKDLSHDVKHRLEEALKEELGKDYFVDLEAEGLPHEHIHIQLNVP